MTGKLSLRRLKAEAEEAENYAEAIRSANWIKPDWRLLNARIIDEFGHAGLLRIKQTAWRIVEAPR